MQMVDLKLTEDREEKRTEIRGMWEKMLAYEEELGGLKVLGYLKGQ